MNTRSMRKETYNNHGSQATGSQEEPDTWPVISECMYGFC